MKITAVFSPAGVTEPGRTPAHETRKGENQMPGLQQKTNESQAQETPRPSEVLAEVEEIVGDEEILAPPRGGSSYPQLRVQVDGLFAFINLQGLDDETIEELEALDITARTSSRDSLQVRVFYETVKAQVDGS